MKERTDCDDIRDDLAALLYGELPANEEAAVEGHVQDCAPCARLLAELRATEALLARWSAPRVVENPGTLAASIAAEARPPRRRGWLRVASAAAVLLFVFLTALGSEVRYANGGLTVRLQLPGAHPAPVSRATPPVDLESTVRRIAAEEVATRTDHQERRLEDWTRAELEARGRLARAFDRLRAEDQRAVAALLDNFQTTRARENRLTREALVDLASLVTHAQ